MNLAEQQTIFAAQVRGIQHHYPRAHAALIEWGMWSRDLAGTFPCLAQSSMWEQFVHDGTEGHGNIDEAKTVVDAERKSERDEERPADEKLAVHLDELIHKHLTWTSRRPLLVAYVLNAPEYQFPRLAAPRGRIWLPEDFLARFEGALAWIEVWL